MTRKPQAHRLHPATRARRDRLRQRWQALRPWLADAAALAMTLLFVALFWGILAMLSVPNTPP